VNLAGTLRDRVVVETGASSTDEGRVIAVSGNVGRENDINALFSQAMSSFSRIDAAVTHAGRGGSLSRPPRYFARRMEPGDRCEPERNLPDLQSRCKSDVRWREGGSILVTWSSSAQLAHDETLPYVTSKATMLGMVNAMALNLAGHGIRVNALISGTTATPAMIALPGHAERLARELPLGELATVTELTRRAVFVLGNAIPHLAGSQLKVDSERTIA
jgi:NAD(P)-dependent dehydrogenase (short-subunit alcohol dehydrogenase family)